MRVLFPFTGTLLGGSYESAGLLARELQKLRGVSVIAALPCEGLNAKRFREYGLEPVFYNPSSSFIERGRNIDGWRDRFGMVPCTVREVPKATSLIVNHEIDLVHIHDDRSMWLWGLAARMLKIPVVWHVRQIEGNRILDSMRTRLATTIVFISNATTNRVSIKSPYVIPNPVDTDLFRPTVSSRQTKRKEIGLKPERMTVGFVGRLVHQKRPEWVVEAGRRLLDQGVDLQVVIVGDDRSGGRYVAKLKEQLRERHKDRFWWLGYRNDVYRIMQGIDVLGVPSAVEGFGRVIIEAMATGVPVVATACGGPSEIIEDGKTGRLVPPDSFEDFTAGIREILLESAVRERMGGAARRVAVTRYHPRHIAGRITGVYESMI